MNFEQSVEFLFSLERFGWRLGLDRMQRFLAAVGNPHENMRFVHIAGTNGKGTVAAIIESIARTAGYRTGLYTSPHIRSPVERIRICGAEITVKEFVLCANRLRPIIQDLECTFFEAMTGIAFYAFNRAQTDLVLCEVGLGGRLDATNVISPEVCIVTSISLDHTDHLGDTLARIAYEKAGVLKTSVPCILGEMKNEAEAVIRESAVKKQCEIFPVNDYCRIEDVSLDLQSTAFDLTIDDFINRRIELPLLGTHQITNACLAALTVMLLQRNDWRIDADQAIRGMRGVRWSGRFEIIHKAPLMVVDVAHNVASVRCTVEMLREYFPGFDVIVVLGLLSDKDVKGIVKTIAPIAYRVLPVQLETARAMQADLLYDELRSRDLKCAPPRPVSDVLRHAIEICGDDQLICITGSHYLVGDVLTIIKNLTE